MDVGNRNGGVMKKIEREDQPADEQYGRCPHGNDGNCDIPGCPGPYGDD